MWFLAWAAPFHLKRAQLPVSESQISDIRLHIHGGGVWSSSGPSERYEFFLYFHGRSESDKCDRCSSFIQNERKSLSGCADDYFICETAVCASIESANISLHGHSLICFPVRKQIVSESTGNASKGRLKILHTRYFLTSFVLCELGTWEKNTDTDCSAFTPCLHIYAQ